MSLQELMRERFGVAVVQREMQIAEGLVSGDPAEKRAALFCALVADNGRFRGETRLEDFQLRVSREVTGAELRQAALDYFLPQGYQVESFGFSSTTDFWLVRGEVGKDRQVLQVSMSNASHEPDIPPMFFPRVFVTITKIPWAAKYESKK